MSKDIVIVSAKEEHISAAQKIAIQAWTPIREEFKNLLGDELYNPLFADWQEGKKEEVRVSLSSGRGYVAVCDGEVLGFISYVVNSDAKVGTVGVNAVSSSARGMGIGPKMYEFILAKMREEGMLYATVHTGLDDAHAPARRAYEKAGFVKNLPSVNYYQKL